VLLSTTILNALNAREEYRNAEMTDKLRSIAINGLNDSTYPPSFGGSPELFWIFFKLGK
jgi:hypothetical protein